MIRNAKDKARFINKVDDYGTNALHHAALKGDLETLKYLVQKGIFQLEFLKNNVKRLF